MCLFFSYNSRVDQSAAVTSLAVTTIQGGPVVGQGAAVDNAGVNPNTPPAGLSESALKRVIGDNPPSPDELEKVQN